MFQVPILPDPSTPRPGPVYLPEFREVDSSYLQTVSDNAMFENTKASLDTESPDSGHREMSCDSLSYNLTQAESNGWSGGGGGGESYRTTVTTNTHCSVNPFRHSYTSGEDLSSCKKRNDDNINIITPCPLQDASGNRLDLKINLNANNSTPTPKIDPPPKFRRTQRMSNGSQDRDSLINIPSDSDYYSTYASSGMGTGSGHKTSGGRSAAPFSDGYSTHSSMNVMPAQKVAVMDACHYSDNNRDSSCGPLRHKLGMFVNDLSNGGSSKQQFAATSSKWRSQVSYASDDASDNSEESNTPSQPSHQRLDTMTIEEFEALGS